MNWASHIDKIRIVVAAVFLFSVIISPLVTNKVYAASLTQSFVRFDRMKISTPTTGTVCAKPATALTEATTVVSFPTGYTLGAFGTFTVNTTNLAWPAGATAWLGINTATAVSLQDVTFPSSDLAVGTLYCFNWTNTAAVTTKSSATTSNAGAIATYATGPTLIDSASYSTATIADDQIVVTATVPQTFSFALSGNTDPLGALGTGTVVTSGTPRTVTVNTNAKNGWQVWAKSAYQGLCSPSLNTCTPGTPTTNLPTTATGSNRTLVAGTADYNTGVTTTQTSGSGTISIAAPFVGTGSFQGGGLSATALQSLASSTGTANTAVMTLKNNVAISAITPAAADYTDTLTVIGAGLF
ncbi:MAG: hypothetical protein JWN75_922 [Candidatus Saccharibacteria bacterium]|jgi:hypothetical protein|nr:hypothetical protein [Candidatus Saccharibacteria bacterium]